jgi:hypothetical protein
MTTCAAIILLSFENTALVASEPQQDLDGLSCVDTLCGGYCGWHRSLLVKSSISPTAVLAAIFAAFWEASSAHFSSSRIETRSRTRTAL